MNELMNSTIRSIVLLFLDIPLSYGITCATDTYNSLNSLEFFWDSGRQRATVGVRLNCVSSEFTPRKCGGERGAALRVQVDTYGLTHPQESKGRLLHCAYCLVKVFKVCRLTDNRLDSVAQVCNACGIERWLHRPMA